MSSQSKYSPEVQKLIAEEAKRRRQMDITIANLARVPASEITERLNESERARTTYFKPTKRVKLSGFQHHCKKIKLQGLMNTYLFLI
jgi:hypothetical protein